MSKLLKIVALIMAILMMTTTVSAAQEPLAEEFKKVTQMTSETETESENSKEASPEIIGEVESLRNSDDVKHFRLSDGTYIAAKYGVPVHYYDNGKWIDYDNSFVEGDSSDSNNEKEYKNKKSNKDVRISKKLKEGKTITVTKNGYKISWGILGLSKVTGKIKDETLSFKEEKAAIKNSVGTIVYADAAKNIDIEYISSGSGVKENIILKSDNTANEFVYEYSIDKLTAVQIDERTIELRNSAGKAEFIIEAPCMVDSQGEMSEELILEIVSQKNKKLTVKLTANEEWLKDDSREYPVTVDPSMKYNLDRYDIYDTYVDSSIPNGIHCAPQYLLVGKNSLGLTRSYIQFDLPQMPNGSMVTNAVMGLYQWDYDPGSGNGGNILAYYLGEVSKETLTQYTWWRQPIYIDNSKITQKVIDYTNYRPNKNNVAEAYTWDITQSVKKSYNDGIHPTFGLKMENENGIQRAAFFSSDNTVQGSAAYPFVYVNYINNNGIEPYWSYHTQSAGLAGMGSVNDFTGNLSFEVPVATMSSEKMPVSLSLVYNLQKANQFDPAAYGTVGKGWKLTSSKRIVSVSDSAIKGTYPYKYIDADGTEHFFKKTSTSTIWEDETEPTLKLKKVTEGGTNYLDLVYESGYTERYTYIAGGSTGSSKLVYEKDSDGHKINYNYDSSGFINNIKDSSGRQIRIYIKNRAYQFTDPEGKNVNLQYDSNGRLIKVTFPGNQIVQFQYDSEGKMTKAIDSDGSYIAYTYYTNSKFTSLKYRVKSAYEYTKPVNGSSSVGKGVIFKYNGDNTTTVQYDTDYSGSFNSAYEVEETYTFNNYGQVTSVVTPDGGKSIAYQSDGKTTVKPEETVRITGAGVTPKYVNNLNHNTSLEGGEGYWGYHTWQPANAVGTSSHGKVTEQHYLGNYSLKISRSGRTDNFETYRQTVELPVGKPVTFSAYLKTVNVTPIGEQNGRRGAVAMIFFYNNGSLVGTYVSDALTGTNNWKRVSVTVDSAPQHDVAFVYVGLNEANGTVYADCMQTEISSTVSPYNMVEFSDASSQSPWYFFNTSSADKVTGGKLHMTGGAAKKKAKQIIEVNSKDVAFTFSAKAKGNSVPLPEGSERKFTLAAGINYVENNTADYVWMDFNPDCTGTQYVSGVIKKPKGKENLTIREIHFELCYMYNANSADFWEFMLTPDETGTSYTYDSKGNLVTASDNNKNNEAYTYNNVSELLTAKTPSNETYEYKYDANNQHRLVAARSKDNSNGFRFTYDSNANVTKTQFGTLNTSGVLNTSSPYIETQTGYNSAGNYITSETDQRGNTVIYDVNSNTGIVNKTTAPDGTETSYTYDSDTKQTLGVSASKDGTVLAENKYQYSADKKYLTNILHNDDDVCYNFEYDKYGRQTKVTVGNGTQSKNLITNGYAYSSGKLIETSAYGNGYVLVQTYDRYGRLEQIKGNQVLKATYDYNSNGLLGRVKDTKAGSVTKFDYDISGRPVLITNTMPMVGSSATLHPSVEYRYGANGSKNLVQVNTMPRYGSDTNPRVADFQYEYYTSAGTGANVGQIKAVKMHSESRLVYTYDTLGRVTEKKYATTDKATTYGYLNVSGNKTTSLVSSVDNFGNKLTYTYDNLGNIKTVSENGTLQETYTYDALSRLTRVDSAVQNKTVVYTYDAGGNILSKTEYPYTTGTLGTAVKTVNYGYTDPVWKDLMTSYDGQTITYDAIGNPLQYRDGMTFTWQGRELLSVTKNGKTVNYTYDSNGQRISKTVDGETTDYYIVDGVRIGEHKAGRDIVYMHDEKGDIYGLCYDGITHYFVQNVQGDIIGILNTTGTLVAKYEYDAWGNVREIPVAEDGCGHAVDSPDHIAHVNPFRYRGYYYDAETGFYYIYSRYYDPEVGRFLNSDKVISGIGESIQGYNVFAYCFNNPINLSDPTGNWPKWVENAANSISSTAIKICATVKNTAKSVYSSIIKLATPNRRPNKGKPGSTYTAPNGDKRTFGSDGRPKQDYDHDDHGFPDKHPHDENGGHYHDWDWSKNPPRGKPYASSLQPIVGVALVTVCVVGIVVMASNDVTGVGVLDDFMFGPLSTGVGEGLILIFS